MRIIHTADWHIGQTLRGYARDHEHRAVLDELVGIVTEREVDALIIAGDVFDSQNPSGEAQRLFYETLVKLHQARPSLRIVVTAGNHDAAGRLEAPRVLLGGIGVHVVGNVRRINGLIDIARHVVPLPSTTREIAAHVLAVSYPTPACLPTLPRQKEEDGSSIVRATQALYEDLMDAARPITRGLPLVMTGHLHVAGGTESEGAERRILVGGQHAVAPDIFPADACYVALGHLHKPQTFKGDRVRYSGSLIPLSATEQPYRHGVTLLTLGDRGVTSIEHIELTRPVPFLRLPEKGDIRLDDLGDHFKALDLDPDLPINQRPFVHVRLNHEGLSAGFRAEADRVAESFPVRLVDLKVSPRPDAPTDTVASGPIVRLSERAPEDLFVTAFQRTHGGEPDASHRDVFHRALANANAEV
ncbi:Nuclease SbcCD subunit D [Candidatus Filomicrobium marinum]|uniref:Nuclease SbcCD subunit D n=1 Tax=Candidatus Filomicrobium marinum TaxID=1608628 RepID=A0A0D6JEK1_9HYPH|nr:exonuclease SbcCD subunit D [Candidatus Filomicrobium marinum]CFX15383.1 Nuclease SbcCD subunit D [Candidatus Filomicrobium marinum]CPR17951.1 Nuclease SbcCD subunit D [Candidatus Filomicrobium marinum]